MRKVLLFVLLAGAAQFVSAAAVLKALSGSVLLESGGITKAAQEGQVLGRQDRVRVGDGGVAQVVFPNGDAVLVKDASLFQVEENKEGTLVTFEQGEFLVGLPEKRKAGQSFRVKTPAALVRSQGGAFWGKSDTTRTSSFASFRGSLDVLAAEKKVELKTNQTLHISYGQPAGIPEVTKIDPIYVTTFGVKGSLQGVDEVIGKGEN